MSLPSLCGLDRIAGRLLLGMALVLTTVRAGADDPVIHLSAAGLDRSYIIHVPGGAPPAGGFPLVLMFHGGGGTAEGVKRFTGLDAIADARGLIVVYPDGIDHHWNDGRATIKNKVDDVAFVNAVLGDVEQRHAVDRSRVYAAGMSNGALFSHRLGCELAGRINAIAAVSGTMPADLAPACRPSRPVSLLQIEGDSDPIMPYGGGEVVNIGGRGLGGTVLSTQETVAIWTRINGCTAQTPSELLPLLAAPDGTQVERRRRDRCRQGARVVFLTVKGGGHVWPGGPQYAPRAVIGSTSNQLDASQTIVDFFLSLPGLRPQNGTAQ